MWGRATIAGMLATGTLVLGGVGVAHADFTATFCQGDAAAPWAGGPAGDSDFATTIDGCPSGGSYGFLVPYDDLASGSRYGAQLTIPAGEQLTNVAMDYSSADTTSGDAFLEIGYGATNIVHSQIGNDNAGTSFNAPVSDATSLFLSVYCVSSTSCDFATHNVATVGAMSLTLRDTGVPSVTAEGGTLAGRGIRRGEQTVGYAATDAGSGVARVTVSLGTTVAGTATSTCQSGALAPCPPSSSGVLTVNTATLPDGTYPVILTAYDASGDPASIDLGSTTLRNHSGTLTLTPALRGLHVELRLDWKWTPTRTTLAGVELRRVGGRDRLTVSCRGRRCPLRRWTTGVRGLRRFERRLRGARFAPGDRLEIVLAAPHRRAERARLLIRPGRIPRVLR